MRWGHCRKKERKLYLWSILTLQQLYKLAYSFSGWFVFCALDMFVFLYFILSNLCQFNYRREKEEEERRSALMGRGEGNYQRKRKNRRIIPIAIIFVCVVGHFSSSGHNSASILFIFLIRVSLKLLKYKHFNHRKEGDLDQAPATRLDFSIILMFLWFDDFSCRYHRRHFPNR